MTTHTAARLAALIAWIVLAVIPLYSDFFVAPTLEGARYLYLPSVGWSILLVTLASHAWYLAPARAAVVVATVVLLGVSAIGVVRHQRPWLEAAALRDQVLESARGAALAQGCPTIDVRNPPDSVEGAYVFRNGIQEALARTNISTRSDEPPMHCTFEWLASTLIPTGPR